jgi:hypothetical protein
MEAGSAEGFAPGTRNTAEGPGLEHTISVKGLARENSDKVKLRMYFITHTLGL